MVWFYVWAHNASALVTVECAIELAGFGVALTVIMHAPTADGQQQDLATSAVEVTEGVEGEPSTLPATGEGSGEIAQDVVMAVVALGVEEASSILPDSSSTPGPLTDWMVEL